MSGPDAPPLDGGGEFDLDGLLHDTVRRAAGIEDLASLDALRTEVLGKRSALAEAQRAVGGLDPEERRVVGTRVKEVRARLEAVLGERRSELEAGERRRRVEADRLDLTELLEPLPLHRRGHTNVVRRTRDELEDVFVGMGFTVAEGPEVETDWYNFEALNMPPAHPARSMFDTFYVDLGEPDTVVLRTHTSPVQIRVLQSQSPPIFSVMPGRAYRRETPDARHLPVFHQIEGLVVDHGISFADLAGTIATFTTAYFGADIHARLRPAFFPFTEPSAEYEITCTICKGSGCRTCSQTGWVELGGCGMVDPAVFDAVGVDSEEWTGFAFGFGIDRCAQMRSEIPDMRILLDNDVRFLRQV